MSDHAETDDFNSDQDESSQGEEILEISFRNLTKDQKSALLIVILTLAIEIVFMAGVRFITDAFKIFLSDQYKEVTDYTANFVSTLIPYIFVIILYFLVFEAFKIVSNDIKTIQDFKNTFDALFYLLLFTVTIIILFGMFNVSTYAELSIFIFIILLYVFIYFFPAYYYGNKIPILLEDEPESS